MDNRRGNEQISAVDILIGEYLLGAISEEDKLLDEFMQLPFSRVTALSLLKATESYDMLLIYRALFSGLTTFLTCSELDELNSRARKTFEPEVLEFLGIR